ncbi:fungal transcriptional regulatory protein [Dactylonectria macrodidyma]|uniref:Fungal transcriptional regulatory protein n=1 Tax=Dactylonectria macrodidyma TaxID=307937 RepID=A0A9P9JKY2_9HYPO|nr:fungal transcriptional regulatory protein [Dactylonectria macrodidyma]
MDHPQQDASRDASRDATTNVSLNPLDDIVITTTSPTSTAKRRRTVTVATDCCRTCRLRKVKCTGNPGNGPCVNCARLDLSCPFNQDGSPSYISGKVLRSTPSHSHTEAGTVRKRAQRACSLCHSNKTKCSGDLPKCKRCEANDLACEYTPAKRKFTHVPVSSSSSRGHKTTPSNQRSASSDAGGPTINRNRDNFILAIDASILNAEYNSLTVFIDATNRSNREILFRKDIIMKHMDAYFQYIYYMPCMGFFRRNTVYQEIQDGTFDPATAAAMCAVTSLFVNPGEAGRVFSMKCSEQVELYVFHSIFRFAEKVLILYALNGYHNFLHGHLAKVWQCFGIATRLMLGLQVNWDIRPRDRSFAHQETMRRIVWQFFYLDRLLAGGYEEYIGCRDEIMKIRLPCSEEAFKADRAVIVERLHEKSKSKGNMGIHGYQLRLIDIRHRVLVATTKMGVSRSANRSRLEPSKLMAIMNGFQNELSEVNTSLPEQLKLNDQNIARVMTSEDRTGYVFIHSCLASVTIDLYSLCLPGLREQLSADLLCKLPPEFIAKCQKQAVAHALCLARFCETLQRRLDQQPYTGRLKLVGCSSMVKFTTQCLRVLLIALQHDLYRELADHTTAPLWSNGPADDPHIRGLIDALLKINKSWCQIIPRNQQSYERNRAAVEQFYQTRMYADQKSMGQLPRSSTTGHMRLPGPQHILETAFVLPIKETCRQMPNDAAAAAQWFGASRPSAQSVTESLQDSDFDVEFGPPGLPMLLAEAQGVSPTPTDEVDTFDDTDDLLLISNKTTKMARLNDLLSPENPTNLVSDRGSLVPLANLGHSRIFQPLTRHHTPRSHATPDYDGYTEQYDDSQRGNHI